nr:DUF6049 family protein [Petropleomorpha daqingensis]
MASAAVCLAALGGSVVGAPHAQAAPDDDTRHDRPISIEVSRLEPRSVVPGAVITVSGVLTNTGDQTVTDLGVRLQRGEVLTTRAELAAADTAADPDTTVVPPFQDYDGSIGPGRSMQFTYTIPTASLQLTQDGVYPVLLNVNGTTGGGDRQRLGELSTYLVQQPALPTGRTTVAWLWPLVERSHRDASGDFVDDGLAGSVRSGGRLDRALSVVEELPRTTPVGGGNPTPSVPVTLAVDPALVEELETMAAGPYAVAGKEDAGKGTDDAAAFLQRLRAVAAVHPVVALPYGDVDADSLQTAGLGAVLTRSLPEAGTASAGGEGQGAGARILADALGVEPGTDVAWVADGAVHPETLAALQNGGAKQVVLDAGALSEGTRAVGLRGSSAAARTSVALSSGPMDALVADPTLGALGGSTEKTAGGVRIAEQRYLAELSVLALQAPADPAQAPSVLIAPPREVGADPDGVRQMMSDTAELPWLRAASVEDLTTGPSSDAGTLVAAGTTALDGSGLADVAAAVASRDDLAGAVVGDADSALAPEDAALSRATSVAWRTDPAGFRDAAQDVRTTIGEQRDRVTLLAPADGTYSLASSDAPLVLTVRNDLPFTVRVLLQLRTRGNVGLSIDDIGPQELAPGERTVLQVPTHVRQSGRFAVTASLTTPSGGPLGDRVTFQVKSTAYGSISLIITIGAAVLLGLLFLRRLIRFLMRRRRGGPPSDGGPEPAPEGAAVPVPPTRSPV